MKQYKKYHEPMDAQHTYYIALVLDSRFKTLLLDKELRQVTVPKVLRSIKDTLLYKHGEAIDSAPCVVKSIASGGDCKALKLS